MHAHRCRGATSSRWAGAEGLPVLHSPHSRSLPRGQTRQIKGLGTRAAVHSSGDVMPCMRSDLTDDQPLLSIGMQTLVLLLIALCLRVSAIGANDQAPAFHQWANLHNLAQFGWQSAQIYQAVINLFTFASWLVLDCRHA